jgi:aspartate ammonia-lyase
MPVHQRCLPDRFPYCGLCLLLKLTDAINQLGDGFQNKAVEFQDILKMGRTQLQDAVPMTLGQEFHAFNVLLNEEIKSILRTGELLLEVNLGATAIGTRLNTPDGYQQLAVQKLAEVSGLPVFRRKT